MNEIATAIIVLVSILIGYKLGKGEPIIEIPKVLKKIVRSEGQERALIDRLEKENQIKRIKGQ